MQLPSGRAFIVAFISCLTVVVLISISSRVSSAPENVPSSSPLASTTPTQPARQRHQQSNRLLGNKNLSLNLTRRVWSLPTPI